MKKILKEVDAYIENAPKEVHSSLREMRDTIRAGAPRATERIDYFGIPGYSYEGYDYDGMFAWLSFKKSYVRLHVRPPVLQNHKKELLEYPTTKAIVSFPIDKKIPKTLVKKLVKESIKIMKGKS